MRDLPQSFSRTQRLLHWAMVGLILVNLLLPQGMGGRGIEIGVVLPAHVHIAVGMLVLVLAAVRLVLRLIRGVPPEPIGAPRAFRVLARAGQWVFYLLFFAMPITGALAYYLGQDTARLLHAEVFRPLFWLLIAIHVSLALAHQYLWRTDMLGKIVRG
ncbi:cytochrome b [Pseudodonghicola flavimaris]|uniref:Cytochrome b/b6 domain-containing protein n=1 Tax=Pseudodonghicola flavimaris TaxID=3050036 RepID=A0ABT7EXP4_9RHOB|nr:cytochrome b/b6 domain-containing protein [Pseudodonghicola flavimaris]MDK3017045.1 cytochrome b/b6 domain-containing protein [Pseudodonghicola flavimaris]